MVRIVAKLNIGAKLRELRLRADLTQDDVAESLGVTAATVSNYENGAIYPSLEIFYKLAKLYNASSDYILGLESQKQIVIDASPYTAEQEKFIQRMANSFGNLIKRSEERL